MSAGEALDAPQSLGPAQRSLTNAGVRIASNTGAPDLRGVVGKGDVTTLNPYAWMSYSSQHLQILLSAIQQTLPAPHSSQIRFFRTDEVASGRI